MNARAEVNTGEKEKADACRVQRDEFYSRAFLPYRGNEISRERDFFFRFVVGPNVELI